MPLDERLRQGLSHAAADVHPNVEYHLAEVLRRARVRTRNQLLGAALAVAAVIVAFIVVDLGVIQNRPTPVADAVQGGFSARVDASETLLEDAGMAGAWSLQFETEGVVEVTAPPSYRGVVSTVLYQVSGDSLRINLFETDLCSGDGIGSYTWQSSNGALRFTAVGDTCAERVALLTERDWQRQN